MEQNRPVDVISVCSSDGTIKPLRMQMTDDDHQLLRVNIDEIVGCKEVTFVGAEAHIFMCRASVLGQRWMFELQYSIRTHTWSILRKIY